MGNRSNNRGQHAFSLGQHWFQRSVPGLHRPPHRCLLLIILSSRWSHAAQTPDNSGVQDLLGTVQTWTGRSSYNHYSHTLQCPRDLLFFLASLRPCERHDHELQLIDIWRCFDIQPWLLGGVREKSLHWPYHGNWKIGRRGAG